MDSWDDFDDLDEVDAMVDAFVDGIDAMFRGTSLPPPGNCTWQRHAQLQTPVHRLCDVPRACHEGMTGCINVAQRIQRNGLCAAARRQINQECYAGGDVGHRIAENEARLAGQSCRQLWGGPRLRCNERTGNTRIRGRSRNDRMRPGRFDD